VVSPRPYCFATGVEAGKVALRAVCEAGLVPQLVLGYDKSLASRAGYASLAELASEQGFELIDTADINSEVVVEAIQRHSPSLLIVAGWSQVVSNQVLDLFPLGGVGLHPTALPIGRGRAPIPWTLIKGFDQSAVTLFHLTDRVDSGDIIGQVTIPVAIEDDATSLYTKVADAQAAVLLKHLPDVLSGQAPRIPQSPEAVEVWPRRRPEDGIIDWSRPGIQIYNWVRGLTHPYPGAFTSSHGNRLTIWSADLVEGVPPAPASPGTVIGPVRSTRVAGIAVGARGGVIIIRDVQLEGEESMNALVLHDRADLAPGDVLG
jgi:methionyl-tRNA formyltransferase